MILQVRELDPNSFKKYGHVLNAGDNFKVINEGRSTKWNHLIPNNTFSAKEGHNIGILRTTPFTPTITKLERHRFTAQLFYPITGKKSLVVVSSSKSKDIDISSIEVFEMSEYQGVCFHPLTWHYQLIPIEETTDYLTIMLNSDLPDIEYSNLFSPINI